MSKKKIAKRTGFIVNTSHELRQKIKFYYEEKFYNKFLNKFNFKGTLDYQQINYIMRQFWSASRGSVAVFKRKVFDESKPWEQLVFAPWVVGGKFNCYDFPITLRFVNTRAVSFIPDTEFTIDVDAVIGYIQRNKKGVYSSIAPMIDKLVDFEMTIRTNLKAQKTPWLLGVSPENETKMQTLWENIESDEPKLFVSIEDLKDAKALVSGANYNIDKLEQQRQQVENEILTRLGIDNMGIMEKKEHFTVDEVNSNQEQIESSSDEYLDCLKEFFSRIENVLGYKIEVELRNKKDTSKKEESKEEEEDE